MKRKDRNATTRLASEVGTLKETSLELAYRLALVMNKTLEPPHGYRLFWLSTYEFGSLDVPVEPEAFLVVGRHTKCDVELQGDPTIALRHLLVRAQLLDDGCPRLSIVDLHTDIGFELAGKRVAHSISAIGPIALRVGAYAIVALPGGEKIPEELPEADCSRAVVAHPYRAAARPAITLLPRALELGESHGEMTGPGWNLSVRGSRGAAGVHLSPLDLEIGVLVGRAPKCNDQVRNVLNDGISRVHLLLRKGMAYDLASTYGTYFASQPVRSVPLDDRGTELRLGSPDPIYLHWAADVMAK